MFEDARKLTCEEFQSQIPELLSSGAVIQNHAHVKTCASCSRLLVRLILSLKMRASSALAQESPAQTTGRRAHKMDREKRLAVLLKIRDGLQETLRSAINKDQVAPENRSDVLSRLASIQREIEFLQKPNV